MGIPAFTIKCGVPAGFRQIVIRPDRADPARHEGEVVLDPRSTSGRLISG
jgi:hypothetical protein